MLKMKSIFILLFLLIATYSIRIPLKRVTSFREKLIHSGKWKEYSMKKARYIKMNDSGREPQRDLDDLMYLAEIGVGTPQKYFTVVMDTGSADFWLPGISCGSESVTCPDRCSSKLLCELTCDKLCCSPQILKTNNHEPCDGKNKFDDSTSSTYHYEGESIKLIYGTGSIEGFTAKDTVCIAGICIKNQTWTVATKLDEFLGDKPLDGICGLAFEEISVSRSKPPVLRMVEEHLLDKSLFTIWLSKKAKEEEAGTLTLGDFDYEHCSETCDWTDVQAGYWMFNMNDVKVGNSSVITVGGKLTAISDSGTSFIHGPVFDVLMLVHTLNMKWSEEFQLPIIPCNEVSTLKPITFVINEKNFDVYPHNYIVEILPNTCVAGIVPQLSSQWILGDCWIRQYCQVHDVEKKRIGFCPSLK
ncbi:Cathepsin E-A [Trichinella papuae]|uniref:Cathepsin E-A n=1 Tax=Trichinella papuae TaxID=268474 RepID=A0A0V1N584_9BILA|nr:Cathepsin E-A [Trichinella papuae]